ncbi:hypothetical protein BGW80DRAFT_1300948, partial [Lactifluus volemus]
MVYLGHMPVRCSDYSPRTEEYADFDPSPGRLREIVKLKKLRIQGPSHPRSRPFY